MKIVMLGHKRIPSREGGIEIVVEELAVRLAAMGHDVTVYNRKGHHVAGTSNERQECGKEYEYHGVHIKTVFTMENKSLNAIIYSFFATLKACFSGATVVHFHAEGPCAMLPIAKLFHKKCVATIHGLDWKRAKWGGFATRFLQFGEKMAAKYADSVIVLSKGVQQYFQETYNRDTILIPNGISKPVKMKPQIIKEKYSLQGEDYLLFLARLVPEKGAHTLLDAYEAAGISIPLVIAGGSSHSQEYVEEIRSKVAAINAKNVGRVIMTGFVEGKELQELYSNCKLYILPSEIEGMPLSLLEAMSFGRLCLTSDIPENKDVICGHGLTFPVGDCEKLKESLLSIMKEYSQIRMREDFTEEKIEEFILGKYNWDVIVKRTLECYEDINRK